MFIDKMLHPINFQLFSTREVEKKQLQQHLKISNNLRTERIPFAISSVKIRIYANACQPSSSSSHPLALVKNNNNILANEVELTHHGHNVTHKNAVGRSAKRCNGNGGEALIALNSSLCATIANSLRQFTCSMSPTQMRPVSI